MNRDWNNKVRLILILLLGFNGISEAQSVKKDTILYNAAQNAKQFYVKAIGEQSGLYNGEEYNYYTGLEGVAYFKSKDFYSDGKIVYDGFLYEKVPLLYDLYKDKIISLLPNGFTKYSFVNEKVNSFDLYNHHFIRVDIKDMTKDILLQGGFFDQIYNGKCKILVKRTKISQETMGTQTLKKYFINKDIYYMVKDNIYSAFSGEKKLLTLFGDRKKELQQYLKDNKIKFNKDPENAMIKLATYYDSLFN
ncbi:hypothetical protein GM921_04560 [Pedobacter sp. LMG 31464]|uniref:WG containing repeat-containing protein n=1 Tax=Pedobacter planticolens TaxID=2679964 RepID=A0A923DZG8_9SPHI|nr:hypothetical protein [Pedobacter planticolens]MBB2144742.1 hypothetical protein [Pedobacter planticolens]